MSAIFTSFLRRALSAAFILTVLTATPSRADWEKLAGNYSGTWKSADSGGASYAGTATISIKDGPGDSVTISMKTTFLGNAVTAKGKATANGKLKATVNNVILGTVTGDTTAKSSGAKASIKGTTVLYDGTATLNMKLTGSKAGLKAKGTLVRAFPFVAPMTLKFSFSGKKK
jgi:hypothetical protein